MLSFMIGAHLTVHCYIAAYTLIKINTTNQIIFYISTQHAQHFFVLSLVAGFEDEYFV